MAKVWIINRVHHLPKRSRFNAKTLLAIFYHLCALVTVICILLGLIYMIASIIATTWDLIAATGNVLVWVLQPICSIIYFLAQAPDTLASAIRNVWGFLCTVMTLYIMVIALQHSTATVTYTCWPNNRRMGTKLGLLSDTGAVFVFFVYAVVEYNLLTYWCSELGWIGLDSWSYETLAAVMRGEMLVGGSLGLYCAVMDTFGA